MKALLEKNRSLCLDCRHFYITWDQHFPYGCRRLDFKAKNHPCIEVKKNSGIDCQYFEAKRA